MAYLHDPGQADVMTGGRVPSMNSLVSVESIVFAEGPARGLPAVTVRNPRGISFDVLVDRGMDIGWADADGMPLAWRAPVGLVRSDFHEPNGAGWTRGFGGGLLTTCGLSSTGAASTANGTEYGLHGRIGNTPARNVHSDLRDVEGVGPSVVIEGDVLESSLGGPSLMLSRMIIASIEHPEIHVRDQVTNIGPRPAGIMFRHHFNIGYPLITDGSVVEADGDPAGYRDQAHAPTLRVPGVLQVGQKPQAEDVLYLTRAGDRPVRARVQAPDGAWLEIEGAGDDWPWMILWRDATPAVNVLGIEPSTSRDAGRAQAERDGEVIELEAGEARQFSSTLRAGKEEHHDQS